MVTAPFWKWVSTECQQFLDLKATEVGSNSFAVIRNQHIGSLRRQKRQTQGNSHILEMSLKGESTECQWGINNSWRCILYNPRAVRWHLPIIKVMAAFMDNMISVDVPSTWKWASTARHQSVNRESTMLGVASWIIEGQCYGIYP